MQTNMFEFMYDTYQIKTKIKLIEFFAGYGSQNLSLKYLGANYEHHRICEWATKSIQAYNDIHIQDYTDYSQCCTLDEIVNYLFKKGISMNYNEPMTFEQIKRKGEQWCRTTYNNIIATNNLVNIQQVKGEDLEIIDTDNFTYLLTYSFPCQDLSLAGKGKGMQKGSGTRSGMLWEVERILKECDPSKLPQVLLMENVPQVHSQENMPHLQLWIKELEKLGYQSYWQDLNSKNFGIPQNRDRCFMISILGDYNYNFPKNMPLNHKLKNLLESNVDEKYYLSEQMINYIVADNEKWTGNNDKSLINKSVASTINTAEDSRRCDASNYICEKLDDDYDLKDIKQKRLYGLFEEKNMKQQLCEHLIASGKVQEFDVIRHSYSSSRMNGDMKDIQQNNMSPTLDTRCDCLGVVVNETKLVGGIGEKKSNGGTQYYQQDRIYDSNAIAMCHPANLPSGSYMYAVESKNNLKLKLNTEYKKLVETIEQNEIPIGEVKHLDLFNRNVTENCGTLTDPSHNNNRLWDGLRIRKLTPKECWRLMGVKDEDFYNVCKNQSNSSLYHLAGDGIVTTCLMAIFGELLGIDWKSKINEVIKDLCYTNTN